HRRQPPRVQLAAASPSASPPARQSPSALRRRSAVKVSAFLINVNPFMPAASTDNSSSNNKVVGSRLSELRSRSADDDRAFLRERSEAREGEEAAGRGLEDDEGAGGSRRLQRRPLGPWPAAQFVGAGDGGHLAEGLDGLEEWGEGEEAEASGTGRMLMGSPDGVITPRSLRYMVADPKPEIKLIHRLRPGQRGADGDLWGSFVDKCRMAWGVFFPPPPPVRRRPTGIAGWAGGIGRLLGGGGMSAGTALAPGLTPKRVVLNRLRMVLVADRCGVAPEQLLEMKAQTLSALAEYLGGDVGADLAQLEVQVSALKPSGERVTMNMGFADMLADEQLRDPLQYDYEFEDEDDYFFAEEDDDKVSEIAEAPAAGLKAVRVAARTVPRSGGGEEPAAPV
ncbi:hypothetical protein TSOC_012134, partial [Tetrabaena socialis]